MNKENNVTWFQITNVIRWVVPAVMIAGSFFALSAKVDLQNQKLDALVENTRNIVADARGDNERIDNHEVRITLLEQKKTSLKLSPSGIASLPQPSPSPSQSPQINFSITQEKGNDKPNPTPQPKESPLMRIVKGLIERL